MTAPDPADTCQCGHPATAHDAGECWWDVALGHEVWAETSCKCRCSWYEPKGSTR